MVDTTGVDGKKLLHLTDGAVSGKLAKISSRVDRKHPLIERSMIRQTQQASLDADLILLLFDERVGMT